MSENGEPPENKWVVGDREAAEILLAERDTLARQLAQKQAECDKWIDALDDAMHRLEVEGQKVIQQQEEIERLKGIVTKLPLKLQNPDRPLLQTKRWGWVDLHDYALVQRDHFDRLVAAEAAGKD